MYKKRKIGILLILIGLGIVSVFYFLLDSNGDIVFAEREFEPRYFERTLNPDDPEDASRIEEAKELEKLLKTRYESRGEPLPDKFKVTTDKETGLVHAWDSFPYQTNGVRVPYRLFLIVGIILILSGTGILLFSFLPKEIKSKGQ